MVIRVKGEPRDPQKWPFCHLWAIKTYPNIKYFTAEQLKQQMVELIANKTLAQWRVVFDNSDVVILMSQITANSASIGGGMYVGDVDCTVGISGSIVGCNTATISHPQIYGSFINFISDNLLRKIYN